MRVTQSMISNNMLSNLTKSYGKLDTYLQQLNTGRKINKPSDDPFIAIKSMSYRTQVRQIEQYKRNANEANLWLDNSDSSLNNTISALHRLKDLASQASNGVNSASERQNILAEAKQLKEDLIDLANTKINGRYIFNGTNSDERPVTLNADGTVDLNFSDESVVIDVAAGTKLAVSVKGSDVFGDDLFGPNGTIEKFIQALDNDDQSAIIASIDDIEKRTDDVLNTRAELGARMNRMSLISDRLASQEIVAKDTMSKNENIDYEVAITNLITQETLHRAALSAGTRIMQPTLLDFLR